MSLIAWFSGAVLALLASAQPVPPAASAIQVEGTPEQGGLLRGSAPPGARVTLNGQPIPVAADGRFIVGLDRDAEGRATLDARDATGNSASRSFDIAPRAWQLEHVSVARRPGGSSAAFMRVRRPELERIVAARQVESDVAGWSQPLIWPARGRITGRFGAQRVYRGEPGSYHNGVDVAAGAGTPILSPADGVVVLASPPAFSLEGNLVIIDHGHRLNSAFLHLTRVDVREGQRIKQGDVIGTVGATGRATGPHLHWALTWNGARLDPERIAGAMND